MNNKKILFLVVFFELALGICPYILFKVKILEETNFISITYSYLIMTTSFALGILTIIFAMKRSNMIFLTLVWGGVLLRLILLTVLTFLTLKFLQINQNTFIFSSFIFYILYLIVEVIYLNLRKIN